LGSLSRFLGVTMATGTGLWKDDSWGAGEPNPTVVVRRSNA